MKLCDECRPAWRAWAAADINVVMPVRFKFASHAGYDDTAHAVMAKRRQRFDDFVALINRQCALIADICARKHQVATVVQLPEPDVGGQYELFREAS